MTIGKIIDWVNSEGDSLAFTRLCMMSLPVLSPLGASLRDADSYEKVPADAAQSVKTSAEDIVGKSCPVAV